MHTTIISNAYYFFPKRIKCFHFFWTWLWKSSFNNKKEPQKAICTYKCKRRGEGEIWFSHQGGDGVLQWSHTFVYHTIKHWTVARRVIKLSLIIQFALYKRFNKVVEIRNNKKNGGKRRDLLKEIELYSIRSKIENFFSQKQVDS